MRIKHTDPAQVLGPANDGPARVTQELVALFYAFEPEAIGAPPAAFYDGLFDGPPPADPELLVVWESGAFAAELQLLGDQR